MALAYSEESLAQVREAINSGELEKINAVYHAIYSKSVKKNCNDCYNEAISQLIKWKNAKGEVMSKTNCKYRFTKNWKNKTVVVTIGGTSHKITAETLSNATAEAILNSGAYRKDIIELNPDYTGTDVVKKNLMEGQPEPQPLLSISKEVKNDGKQLKQTASAKK